MIHLFDKNSFRYLTSTTSMGQGPNEIASIGDICVDDENRIFYVFDSGKRRIFSYQLDSVLNNPLYAFQTKARLDKKLYPDMCYYVNDSLCIVQIVEVKGDYEEVNELAGQWDMNTGKIKKIGYENPHIKKKRFNIAVSPEHGLYVQCYTHYDLMTICSLDGILKYNVYGPDWKNEVTETCHYNMDVKFCGDKIFALYSGSDHRSNDFYPTKFFVFDLDGNYLKTIDVGYHILHFCYDESNNRIILYFYDDIQFAYLKLDRLL